MEAMGQDFRSLREKAEKIVRTTSPNGKLVGKEEGDKQVSYLWGPKKADVVLTIFYGASEEEAVERMNAMFKFLSVGPGKKRTGIGDEAYSWNDERTGFAGIRFRKANVYVDLSAPSAAMAEDLARELLRAIKKK